MLERKKECGKISKGIHEVWVWLHYASTSAVTSRKNAVYWNDGLDVTRQDGKKPDWVTRTAVTEIFSGSDYWPLVPSAEVQYENYWANALPCKEGHSKETWWNIGDGTYRWLWIHKMLYQMFWVVRNKLQLRKWMESWDFVKEVMRDWCRSWDRIKMSKWWGK